MELQWFPGHMAKTRRLITENLKLVDVVVELLDARLPMSSRNPEIDKIVGNRPRVLVLNKADMADEEQTKIWLEELSKEGFEAIAVDSRSGKGFSSLEPAITRVMKEKIERDRAKGIGKHSVKLMVVGIPNVGKSSFINRLSGRSATKTGDRPGITTAKQWIRIAGKYELLDTPGILWPKFEDPEVGMRLACIGSINDEILQMQEMAAYLIKYLTDKYPGVLQERYQYEESQLESLLAEDRALEECVLWLVCESRKCYKKGNEPDYEKAASLLLDDFRSGRLGRISLEGK